MKFLLFGTGDYYQRYKKWFHKDAIVALIDNASDKQNTTLDGIKVLSPQDGAALQFDVVVILSFYIKDMRSQLINLGVAEDVIYHFYDLHRIMDKKELRQPLQYFEGAQELIASGNRSVKKILLLSQDMTLGGPAIALFHAAEILIKHGYKVVYASMLDGPLREKLLLAKIPVVVDANLQLATMQEAEWTGYFSLLICNTINFHVFLQRRNNRIPVVWWLHDSEFFYDGIDKTSLQEMDRKNLKVVSVGPIPQMAMQKFVPECAVGRLLYGVTDMERSMAQKRVAQKKICFVTIGFMEDIKGQDLLIEALQLLPERKRQNAEFWLVGHDKTFFAQKVREMSRRMPEVKFVGSVDREAIHRILDEADVLICPSRQDSMPTVAAEAMMHSVPCIMSDAAGTAAYMQDGVNGFVFQSENVEQLSAKIAWCMEHNDQLLELGIRSRKIYEQYFSMKVFENNLLDIVEEMLPE